MSGPGRSQRSAEGPVLRSEGGDGLESSRRVLVEVEYRLPVWVREESLAEVVDVGAVVVVDVVDDDNG